MVAPSLAPPVVGTRVPVAGALCVAAGLLGAASGLGLAVVEPVVPVERFSYPLAADGYVAVQLWFAVHHLGLLAGLLALPAAGALPPTRSALWGWRAAVAGMVGLTLTEVAALAAAESLTTSSTAGALGAAYGVDCLLIGGGLLVAGAAAWHAHAWSGWRRGLVLAIGAWVFVPMMPALALTPTDGARLAIGGWMLLFAALGVALRRRS